VNTGNSSTAGRQTKLVTIELQDGQAAKLTLPIT
jgi:hypothetical protein